MRRVSLCSCGRANFQTGASIDEEEVGWDEDDSEDDGTDSEEEEEEKEEAGKDVAKALPAKKLAVKSSTDTLQPTPDQAKPDQAKSKTSTFTDLSSQPDSESSYDLVSGAPSGAPSQTADSPHQARVRTHLSPDSSGTNFPVQHVDEDSSDEEADWE